MKDIADDLGPIIREAHRAGKALLGAMQYAIYAKPGGPKYLRIREREGKRVGVIEAEEESRERANAHINISADQWFEAVNKKVGDAFNQAQTLLSEDWELTRDPRNKGEAARAVFADKMAGKIEGIADALHDVSHGLDKGYVRRNPAMERQEDALREALSRLIAVYDQHYLFDSLQKVRKQVDKGRNGPGSGVV
ncbi:MAG: hypothetical protein K2Q01_04705 [Rickettsiales bacterium]|nr:hypothetical protein [Rickettsiales bacterium]